MNRPTKDTPRKASGKEEAVPSEDTAAYGAAGGYDTRSHNWILQNLHHVGRDVGKLMEAVSTLKREMADVKKTLDWLKWIAGVATGALFIIGYFIDKRFDQIFEAITKK